MIVKNQLVFLSANTVSNTPQKQDKNGQFGNRFLKVFVDFELKT